MDIVHPRRSSARLTHVVPVMHEQDAYVELLLETCWKIALFSSCEGRENAARIHSDRAITTWVSTYVKRYNVMASM